MKNKLQIKDLRHKLSWLLCLVAFLAVAQEAFAWGCVQRCTSKQSSENPTYYVGDQPTFWWCFDETAKNADFKRAYVGTSDTFSAMGGPDWTSDSCDALNQTWKVSSPVLTSAGTWYYSIFIGWSSFSNGRYYGGGSNKDCNGSTSYKSGRSSFTVNALPNATSQSATAASSSQIDLAWTKNATQTTVMIVRYLNSASVTAPTNGTEYNTTDKKTIGAGTVIYKDTGASKSDTGLTGNTTYKYYFYTVNNNYYSSGVNASATTQSACTPPSAPAITGTTEVCSGSTTTLTSSNANTVWYIGSTQKGTGATYTTDAISANITVDAYAYSGDVSCKSSKVSTNITKKDKPAQPGSILGEAALCANTTYTNRFSITAVSEATSYTWSKSGDGNFTVTGNGTQCTVTTASNYNGGTLQVIATNDCGSSTARTLSLTKVADPTVSLSASAASVCSGSDVTITATVTNVSTFEWSTPTGWTKKDVSQASATYTTAGTGAQTITYTGYNSCNASASANVSVTAIAIPTVSISVSADACGNGNITFSSSNVTPDGATVKWYDGSGNHLADNTTYTFNSVPAGESRTAKAKAVKDGCESAMTAPLTGSRKVNPVLTITVTSDAVTAGQANKTYGWEEATINASTDSGSITSNSVTQTTGTGGIISGNTVKGHVDDVFTGSYTATGTNGCTSSGSQTVTVIKAVEDCD